MRRLRDLLVLVMVLSLVSSAHAGWFDYDEEEYLNCNQKYFAKPELQLTDFLELDLAIIENRDDAKMLYRQLKEIIKPKRVELEQMVVHYEAKKPEVERYFDKLYAKEVHDELWEKEVKAPEFYLRSYINEH